VFFSLAAFFMIANFSPLNFYFSIFTLMIFVGYAIVTAIKSACHVPKRHLKA